MWKVVIIDDDFQVLRGLRNAIPWEELEAEFAGEAIDGETGLKLIEEVQPDIVLTDIYMPVMNGMQMIEQLKKRSFAGRFIVLSGYNDFEYARTAIRLGVDDYLSKPITIDQIREVLSVTINKLEETYLKRLQLGRKSGENELLSKKEWFASVLNEWSREGESASFPFYDSRETAYAVMVIEVLWSDRVNSISLADWNLFKFAVSNILEEVLADKWEQSCFIWLFGNRAALLLPFAKIPEESEAFESAEDLGRLIVDSMNTFLGLKIRYAVGEFGRTGSAIKASADQAVQQLLEHQTKEAVCEQTSSGENIGIPNGKKENRYRNGEYRAITEALQKGQAGEAMALIRLFLERGLPEETENPLVYRMLAAELWTLLQNATPTAGLPIRKSEDEALALRGLSEVTDRADVEAWMESQIYALLKGSSSGIQEKHRKAVQFVIEYIHEHYAEDITLERMASQLYISKNYLNQLFKKVTGETLTNYVIRVRIEKAKSLLKDGNYLIYEVSEMVGYQNVPYFSTLFKKYCGVSPSDLSKR